MFCKPSRSKYITDVRLGQNYNIADVGLSLSKPHTSESFMLSTIHKKLQIQIETYKCFGVHYNYYHNYLLV